MWHWTVRTVTRHGYTYRISQCTHQRAMTTHRVPKDALVRHEANQHQQDSHATCHTPHATRHTPHTTRHTPHATTTPQATPPRLPNLRVRANGKLRVDDARQLLHVAVARTSSNGAIIATPEEI